MRILGPRYRERFTGQPVEMILDQNSRVKLGTLRRIWAAGAPYGLAGQVNSSEDIMSSPMGGWSKAERIWDEVHPGPPFETGGPLTSCKGMVPTYSVQGTGVYQQTDMVNSPDRYYEYSGGFGCPNFINDTMPLGEYIDVGVNQVDNSFFPSLDALGADAYNRLRPQIQEAQLGVALAEMRDMPRMLRTTALNFRNYYRDIGGYMNSAQMQPKYVADQFLNVQFGWKPFLKDLMDLDRLHQDFAKYATQAGRSNGTWQKRFRANKALVDEAFLEATPTGRACEPASSWWIYPTLCDSAPFAQLHISDEVHVWYSGEFKFYRPEFDEAVWWSDTAFGDLMRASTLSGIRVNPSVIWKATPWSWLIDWVSDAGKTIQQISDRAFDGMVSKYMYLMHHKVRTSAIRQTMFFKSGGTKTFEWQRKADIKRRLSADGPYGFRLDAGSLNSGQLAILAALGTSRGPRRGIDWSRLYP